MIPALAQLLLAAQLTLGSDATPKVDLVAAAPQKARVVKNLEPIRGKLASLNGFGSCTNASCTVN